MELDGLVGSNGAAYRPREYQLEMLEASRKQNIIVAMDTGSGKTHIAVLRIIAELETCSPDKLVWFLAPTVALCLQQHEVIASQIPSVKTRVLTGLDNVDRWTEQAVWNEALKDVRVVVSTHAVLSDALCHGFVLMSLLALIIFDEAHHCTRGHPANKIMKNHYHPARRDFGPHVVPRILGLTASPIVRSSGEELQVIEANLDAVCKTPRVHRTELLEHTHQPHLERVEYLPCGKEDYGRGSRLLLLLTECAKAYEIKDDPYVEMLRRNPDKKAKLDETLRTGKTFCSAQLKKFVERSCHIYDELGGWAADYFIDASIDQLRRSIHDASSLDELDRMEKVYLLELLFSINAPNDVPESSHTSPKLQTLLEFQGRMDSPEFSGLIFAKQRVTVSMLARILSMHPATKDRFQCAAFVGWSGAGNRREWLGEILSRDMQRDTLSEFKAGKKNLIVATDALEEGIDVSSCSLVICYNKPSNLKSFVQRRGRARHKESTYAIMISTEDDSLDLYKWQQLEQAMVKAYQDDQRQHRQAWEMESIDEEVADRLFVPSTNALLTAEEAMQHLHHFCAVLPSNDYTDNRPMLSFEEDAGRLLKGTVTLPSCVHPAVRRTQGVGWWRTERAARKESAFQAYKALWKYGLVNDNLLPLTSKPELRFTEVKELPSIVESSEQYDPYVDLAQAWASSELYQTCINVTSNGSVNEDLSITMVLPKQIPMPEPMPFYWDSDYTFLVSLTPTTPIPGVTAETIHQMRRITSMYLQAPSSRQRGPEQDFVALFVPNIPHGELEEWFLQYQGSETAMDVYSRGEAGFPIGIVRDQSRFSEPRTFKRWIVPGVSSAVELECESLLRRRNLLQVRALAVAEDGEGPTLKAHTLPAAACTIDKLPAQKAVFGLFISAILDRLEAAMVAHKLNDTILKGVGIQNLSHVLTAISTPIAQASTNYQRYEFFGDSVLKFTVSCQLFFTSPQWHEGYLSESRDKVIQNNRLARAALDTGLDSFILIRRFTPRKWDAPLISQKLTPTSAKRQLSSKVLADVVEALIGAGYMDGGLPKAQACLHRFLPEIELFTNNIPSLDVPTGKGVSNLVDQHCLARLLGYTFTDAALLTEALTHPSCEHDTTTQSYQRVEYLGDAVLDMVVVDAIAAHPTQLPQGQMTLIKHAVVNANLLAFLCMEFSIEVDSSDANQGPGGDIGPVPLHNQINLWRFLRFNGPAIRTAREACLTRHHALRQQIHAALQHSPDYPWELFTYLHADKFFSDTVESVLGALFIDSRGNLELCRAFVEKIGLLQYVRRVIADGVNVVHPRNTAQNMVKSVGNLIFNRKRMEAKTGATYRCSALVNKVEIAAVDGCATGEEAEVKVAHAAIAYLKAQQETME
ncbi:hypothetical protein NUU61_003489 [Penicillium alfredii]|uniref:Dicer-like protein 2 n=1 Tax=Penicillium alfredii TaxID=1506179 RepID=A0A9W9KDQ7_9EURO|nr:uncharacterized protein NUU61_003489 [Penicillium alfredii]KAJ5101267.1 hypothetical protein NUU61_003489 [Penicillium alfredii]